jgi:hypothetical protein
LVFDAVAPPHETGVAPKTITPSSTRTVASPPEATVATTWRVTGSYVQLSVAAPALGGNATASAQPATEASLRAVDAKGRVRAAGHNLVMNAPGVEGVELTLVRNADNGNGQVRPVPAGAAVV